MAKIEAGLSAQPIYQDLTESHGFSNYYHLIKRFARKPRALQPERIWRLECQPGEEVQVDFGLGAPIDVLLGKTPRSWVLRMVLSYSRKGCSEAVIRQDTETSDGAVPFGRACLPATMGGISLRKTCKRIRYLVRWFVA
jgi:hypothetical protein